MRLNLSPTPNNAPPGGLHHQLPSPNNNTMPSGGETSNSNLPPASPNNNHNYLKRREMSVDNLAASYDLAYMEGVEAGAKTGGGGEGVGGMRRSTSWYDGFFGCLKPMWTFMGKTGKPSVANGSSGEGKAIQFVPFNFQKRVSCRQSIAWKCKLKAMNIP